MIYTKPNIRRWFIADPGKLIWEADLKQADAQVVAWDTGDESLIAAFRYMDANPHLAELHDVSGREHECICLHCVNCMALFGVWNKRNRYLAKMGVHAANYGISPHTLAKSLGITVRDATDFLRRWFIAHPAIKDWQGRVRSSLKDPRTRGVRNAFGYRKIWQGRQDDAAVREALAWIAQSTVAEVINRAMKRVHTELLWAELLMQVHDSLVGQAPLSRERAEIAQGVLTSTRIEIPYPEPLIIGREIKIGPSWGEVK